MQESFPKGRPKENIQNSSRIGAHRPVWLDENNSMEGAWFLMIFTNNNTKVVWTYFLKQKLKALATLKEFQWWKLAEGRRSSPFRMTMAVNSFLKLSRVIAKQKAFNSNLLHHTTHNRMVSLKGSTKLWLRC